MRIVLGVELEASLGLIGPGDRSLRRQGTTTSGMQAPRHQCRHPLQTAALNESFSFSFFFFLFSSSIFLLFLLF